MYLKDLKRKLALCLAVFTFFSAMPVDMQRVYGAEKKAMSTEQAVVNVNGNDLASSRETIAAEKSTVKSQAGEGWWEDYRYTIYDSDEIIVLGRYVGSATDITIPATAVIDGKTYKTEVGDNCFYLLSNLTSISFDPGVKICVTHGYGTADSFFRGCSSLVSLDISNLDTSGVTDMRGMFNGCSSLTSLDLRSFDTSSVTNMESMFYGCSNLSSLDLSSFDTSNVTNMSEMFNGCSNLSSLDLSSFDTSGVTRMRYMFDNCSSLETLKLGDFDTSNVTDMGFMFDGCKSLSSLDLSSFETSNVTDMFCMFNGCKSLTSLDLSSFDTSNVTTMDYMFSSCISLMSIDLSSFNTRNLTSLEQLFSSCNSLVSLDLSSFDTSNVTDISAMFNGCSNLSSLNLSSFDTGKITDMSYMFSNLRSLTSIDLSSFDTSNVTKMAGMFQGCSNLTSIDLSSFDTGNVTGMDHMFNNCSNLTSIDLSGFDTGNVTGMDYMFHGCSSLTNIDLSSFDTSKVNNMRDMFYGCSNLTYLDLSNFDTGRVTNMVDMFSSCSSLISLDLSSFDTSKSLDIGMLLGCSNLQVVYYPKTNGLSLEGVNTLTNVYIPDTVTHLTTEMIPKRNVIYGQSASNEISTQTVGEDDTVIHANSDPGEVFKTLPVIHAKADSYGWNWGSENGYSCREYENYATGDTTGNNSSSANAKYLAVYDLNSRKPVKGAKLYSDKSGNLIGTSEEAGFINVSDMEVLEPYTIKHDLYDELSGNIIKVKQVDCVYLTNSHEYLKYANLMDTSKKVVGNVLTERVTICNDRTYYINLETSDEVKRASLISGLRVIGKSAEGTITFNSADINNYDTFLSLFDEGDRLLRSYPLNINVSSMKNAGLDTISLGGDESDASVKLDEDIPVIGGLELKLDWEDCKVPIIIDDSQDSFKIGIGDEFYDEKKTKKEILNELKNYKWDDDSILKKLAEDHAKMSSKKLTFNKPVLTGYLEGEKSGIKGSMKLTGHLQIATSLSFEAEKQSFVTTPVGPIPVVIGLEVEGSLTGEGTIELNLKGPVNLETLPGVLSEAFANVSKDDVNITAEGKLGLTIKGAIGLKDIVEGGVYGKVEVSAKYRLLPTIHQKMEELKLAGGAGLYGKLFVFEGKLPLLEGETYVKKNGEYVFLKNKMGANSAILEGDTEALYASFHYDPDISTLGDAGGYSTWEPGGSSTNGKISESAVQDNTDLNLVPKLVTCSNNAMLYFVTGAENCEGLNRRANSEDNYVLAYSIYQDDGSWSAPRAVNAADNTADLEPVMYADEGTGKIYAVWHDARESLQGITDLNEYVGKLDLEAAVFDTASPESGFTSLGDIKSINSPDGVNAYEQSPAIIAKGEAVNVYWDENETDNILGLKGGSKIYRAIPEGTSGTLSAGLDGESAALEEESKNTDEGGNESPAKYYAVATVDIQSTPEAWNVTQVAETTDPIISSAAGNYFGTAEYVYATGTYDKNYTVSSAEIYPIVNGVKGSRIDGSASANKVGFAVIDGNSTLYWHEQGGIYYLDDQGAKKTLAEEGSILSNNCNIVYDNAGKTNIFYTLNGNSTADIYRRTTGNDGKLGEEVKLTESASDNYIEKMGAFAKGDKIVMVYNRTNASSNGDGTFSIHKNSLLTGKVDASVNELELVSANSVTYWSEDLGKNITKIYANVANRSTVSYDKVKLSLKHGGNEVYSETINDAGLMSGAEDIYAISVDNAKITEAGTYVLTVTDENGGAAGARSSMDIMLGEAQVEADAYVTYHEDSRMLNINIANHGAAKASGTISVNCIETGKVFATFDYEDVPGGCSSLVSVKVDRKLFSDYDELNFEVLVNPETPQAADLALRSYATIYAPAYPVVFFAGNEIYTAYSVSFNRALTLPDKEPVSSNSADFFAGWYSAPNCRGRQYKGGEIVRSNLVLYAGFMDESSAVRVTGVTLDKHELTLTEGEKAQLTATITPENATKKSVTWASSEPDKLKVDAAGNVSAISECKAKVTVKTADGGFTDTCEVTVKAAESDPDPAKPEPTKPDDGTDPGSDPGSDQGIDKIPSDEEIKDIISGLDQMAVLSGNEAYMVKGQSYSFGSGSWTSSDKTVITIGRKNGKAKAKKKGTATLTNGTAAIRVTVLEPAISAKKATVVVGESASLALDGIDASLSRYYPVTWISEKPTIAYVDGGKVTGLAPGTAKVKAYVKGRSYSCTVKIRDSYSLPKILDAQTGIKIKPLQTITLKYSKGVFTPKGAVWTTLSGNNTVQPMEAVFNAKGTKITASKNAVVQITPAGKLTGIGEGVVSIKGVDKNGRKVSLTVEVSMASQRKRIYLNTGKTAKMKFYKVNNGKASNWTSASGNVASVSTKGVVKALASGNSSISCVYKGFTFSSNVYVEAPALITDEHLTGGNKAGTYRITMESDGKLKDYRIKTQGISQKVLWKSSKPAIVFVDEYGRMNARAKGKAVVKTKINGKTLKIQVEVK